MMKTDMEHVWSIFMICHTFSENKNHFEPNKVDKS